MTAQETTPALRNSPPVWWEASEPLGSATSKTQPTLVPAIQQAVEELAFWSWLLPHDGKYEPTQTRLAALLTHALAHSPPQVPRSIDEALTPHGPLERTTGDALRFRHAEAFAAGYIVRQWKQHAQGRTTVLGAWLPSLFSDNLPPLCWVETHCPNLTGPAGLLPPFRSLLFEPRHRPLLLSVVEQLYASDDTLDWEAAWLNSLSHAPYLSDFALQCLARCHSDHSALPVRGGVVTLPEALVAQRRRFAHGFSKNAAEINYGFVSLAHARNQKNKTGIVKVVAGLLGDTSDHIRIAAVNALLHLGTTDPDTLRMLWILARFKTGTTTLRRAAVRVAAHLSVSTDIVEILRELALDGDDDTDIRIEALTALAAPGTAHDYTIAALRSLAQRADDDTEVRCAAINALGEVQADDTPTVTLLSQLLRADEQDIYIREVALRVLVGLGLANASLAACIAPLLTDLLLDTSGYLRTAAIKGLTQLGNQTSHLAQPDNIAPAERRVASRDEPVWRAAQEGDGLDTSAMWQIHWEQWKQGKHWLRASDIEKIRLVALSPVFDTLRELRQSTQSAGKTPSEWKDLLHIILFNLADFATEPDPNAG